MNKNIITVKNIKTGEVLEFTSQKAVAEYLTNAYNKKIHVGTVANAINQKKPYRGQWKVRFKEVANG